ncbi:MAG: hypothetical protein JSR99_10015 [Proteobacteria bacterium]|nr:hypothetical protein [Pseudomonadota bacterium]
MSTKLPLRLCLGLILSTLPLGRAYATDQNINLKATVPEYCTIEGSSSPADDDVTVPILGNGNVDTTLITRSYAVVCNSAANVSLTSLDGAMVTSTTAGSGFDTFINYEAGTNGFVNISAAATTNTGSNQLLGTATTSGAESANLNVTIQPISNSNPLAGGDYLDTLKVSITPIM